MVVSRPLVVEGHLVPTNSHIIPNIYAIHMDPASWPQPELFNPAHFLVTSDNGEVRVVKPKAFVPFGVGQRMCLFDRLAEAELQLVLRLHHPCVRHRRSRIPRNILRNRFFPHFAKESQDIIS